MSYPVTDREMFVYIMTCMMKDKTMQSLDIDSRTGILEILRTKFCPSVNDQDWNQIQQGLDKRNLDITTTMITSLKRKDLRAINQNVLDRFRKQTFRTDTSILSKEKMEDAVRKALEHIGKNS
jgi:hypothetical protein